MRRTTIFSLLLTITVYGLFFHVSGVGAWEHIDSTPAAYTKTLTSAPAAACTKVAQPGPNLKAFVNSLVPGDVGCLRAGVHGARGTEIFMTASGTQASPITLRGYPG